MLNILVTNNHLKHYGGSETFTYAFIEELCKRGYNVEYFTLIKGAVSDKIEQDLGVNYLSKKKFDVVFANHVSCIEVLRKKISPFNTIIQTCHGIYPDLEQPSNYADAYVSISREVQKHLLNLGKTSSIILNGINTNRFYSKHPINEKLTSVLSLCQSDQANSEIKKACSNLNITFLKLNKFKNPIWNVEDEINKVDLVIGLGRSAYEALACGRPVIVYDNREYSESYADGYLTLENINNLIKNNCSGRYFKHSYNTTDLTDELKKYDSKTGLAMRDYALENLNIGHQVKKYIHNYQQLSPDYNFRLNNLIRYIYFNLTFNLFLPYYYLKTPIWFKKLSDFNVTKNDIKYIRKLTKERMLTKTYIKEQIQLLVNKNK